jgi:methylated-DNA-[protein]-cysteine S-methyltransferase
MVEAGAATNPRRMVFDLAMGRTLRSVFAPTPLGAIAIIWSDAGIVATWMHGGTLDRARAQTRRAHPSAIETAPPPAVAAAIEDIDALLNGAPRDLSGVALDFAGVPEFDRRVYEVARAIPPGSTLTYGEIAKALGEEPMRARDVGVALARNPYAPIVPCHRIVAANGRLGGYSAPGGTETKRRLLEIEGAEIVATRPSTQPGLFDAV